MTLNLFFHSDKRSILSGKKLWKWLDFHGIEQLERTFLLTLEFFVAPGRSA
jgi:hypothetical protein